MVTSALLTATCALAACEIAPAHPDGGAPALPLAGCTGAMAFDVGADGTADGLWLFRYDQLGEPAEATFDRDLDGTPDSRMRFTYDGRDRLIRRRWDGDDDGVVDALSTYTYDGDDRLTAIGEDQRADGTEDRVESFRYEGDRLVYSIAYRLSQGKSPSKTQYEGTYQYDPDGWNTSILWTDPEKGATLVTREPDPDGNLIREVTDLHADGQPEQIERTTWSDGRRAQVDKDVDADGQADYRSTWSYDCP